ncbi:MAG: type IV pilin-like G/H family protein [Microcoleus sp.]
MVDRELLLYYKKRVCSPCDTAAGFTLIELLVVILIIGILAAIALPTFFKLIGKAKETEAAQYISYLNKHQKAQYLEATGFTNSFGTLSFSQDNTATSGRDILKSFNFSVLESKNYLYGIKVSTYQGYPIAAQVAVSKNLGVRSYFGIVWAKDNNMLVSCGPQAVDVSLASPVFKQVRVVTEFLATPEIYCPH